MQAGYIQGSLIRLQGCQLSTAFTQGIIAIEKVVVFKSRLIDVPEFNDEHIDRALAAAKKPSIEDETGKYASADDSGNGARSKNQRP